MSRHSRTYSRGLPLFMDTSDRAADVQPGSGTRDPLLMLAIARLDIVRSDEKSLLAGMLSSTDEFLGLNSARLEKLLLRRFDADAVNPETSLERARADMELLSRLGAEYICILDSRYPLQLRMIYRCPFGLYARGRLPDPERPMVAVVGTRIPTGRGLSAAYSLAADLSAHGICVVSGLARGIDAAAHRGALKGNGGTVAVLPAGIEGVYPQSNRGLAASILDRGGALLTEYPPFSEMRKYRFPERNRIIAGLARSCVVIEAPDRSGALITADHALTEGRDVFVHAGCLGSSRDSGALALASQGAGIVNNAEDILADWRVTAPTA